MSAFGGKADIAKIGIWEGKFVDALALASRHTKREGLIIRQALRQRSAGQEHNA